MTFRIGTQEIKVNRGPVDEQGDSTVTVVLREIEDDAVVGSLAMVLSSTQYAALLESMKAV